METTKRTVSELSSLFRMLQIIPDAESVGKIYQMLLAFCTAWHTIGVERAFLLVLDPESRVLQGHLGTARTDHDESGLGADGDPTFEAMAKNVFETFDSLESSDLTLKTRSFTVPLDWRRCAAVKALSADYPLLAERRMSEFATDPFFNFFGTDSYIAIPVHVGRKVLGVVAADNACSGRKIGVEDISLVSSMTHQAALAVGRLLEAADNKRRFRILRKSQEIFKKAETPRTFTDGLNVVLSMVCRAVGASGAFAFDAVHKKTLHVKTVSDYEVDAKDADIHASGAFDKLLERATGAMRAISGDGGHALLDESASLHVHHFYVCPLALADESYGAISVYVDHKDVRRDDAKFEAKDLMFVELCAGMIAQKLANLERTRKLERTEEMFHEMQANLIREREDSRVGERALDYYHSLTERVSDIREVITSAAPPADRLDQALRLVSRMDDERNEYDTDLAQLKKSQTMQDVFALTREVVDEFREPLEKSGVELSVNIPARGPSMLLDVESMKVAFRSIMLSLRSAVAKDDKVRVECTCDDKKVVVAFADTGRGMPGDVLSRLLMPFASVREGDERKSAMSRAGDIIHRHAGEILIRSSVSWKSILAITLPLAASRDRRSRRQDRRARAADRRG